MNVEVGRVGMARDKMNPHAAHVMTDRVHAPLLIFSQVSTYEWIRFSFGFLSESRPLGLLVMINVGLKGFHYFPFGAFSLLFNAQCDKKKKWKNRNRQRVSNESQNQYYAKWSNLIYNIIKCLIMIFVL